MKKITSVLLTVVMLASMLSVTASAIDAGDYVEASARVNDTTRIVTVAFTAAQPTTNGRITVRYDAGSLTYVDCDVNGTASSVAQSAGTVTFGYGTSTPDAIRAGGDVATLTLRINQNASGTTYLDVDVEEFNGAVGLEDVSFQVLVDLGEAAVSPTIPFPTPAPAPSPSPIPIPTPVPTPTPEDKDPADDRDPGSSSVTPPPAVTDPSVVYDDVSAGQWFYPAVSYVVGKGYFQGTSANTFSPDSAMTRAMFVTVLGRMAGIDENARVSTSFTDVSADAWYAAAVAWASREKIVMGTSDTTFGPSGNVTREQMVVFLYRFAQYLGLDVSADVSVLNQYSDSASVSSWAVEAMAWAIGRGIISGTGRGLEPKAFATRAQVAQIILSFSNLMQ